MPYKDANKQRLYQLNYAKRRRQKWLEANGPCVDCGGSEELEVDHIDPSTKVDHRVWTWSLERRYAELAKCRPRCKECHKKKTAKDKWRPVPHGTNTGYTKRKCRCDMCCRAHTEEKRSWRERARAEGRDVVL